VPTEVIEINVFNLMPLRIDMFNYGSITMISCFIRIDMFKRDFVIVQVYAAHP